MESNKTAWTAKDVRDIHDRPLLDLVFEAAKVHRQFHPANEVQISTLLSIKTGGCPEDCAYCPQAARYFTDIEKNDLMSVQEVRTAAERAKIMGSSRLCMGAAWRNVRDDADFDHVLELVKTVNGLDMEVCCTLGMITEAQAIKLAQAGLYAYNHNLDTSEEYYKEIISTRGYEDRLKTLENVRKAKLTICSGGIVGMGESIDDRCKMLATLANLDPQPESVPINALVAVEGTPLENQAPVPIFDMVRMVATARIVMPRSSVRLSAGRTEMSREGQALCFLAGANSIFSGEKLLTTPNPAVSDDLAMFEQLGLKPRPAYAHGRLEEMNEKTLLESVEEKWGRPKHDIARNKQYAQMAKEKRKGD
jgi:biotin synthase